MIEITARAGAYRKGLIAAADRLSPEEAAIIADLERHGLQVPQLHDLLCGGHVLVDDPQLYEDWRSAKGSHRRLSSHHHDIDKTLYPDIGMRGIVVREKLHGRTNQGTWVQLEKTPAAFGKNKLPRLNDFRHLMDYVVYRITRSNVGPWGLSRMTERRPMYLSPNLALPTSLHAPGRAVADPGAAPDRRGRRRHRGVRAIWRPASRPRTGRIRRLSWGRSLSGRAGRGLFGNSEVWVTESPSPLAPCPPPAQDRPRVTVNATDGRISMNGSAHRPSPAAVGPGEAAIPEGLVSAVVNLVNTGPVLLGAYTIAELTAVDAIVDFLEARPSDDVLAEAVRSLAARQLLAGRAPRQQVQVRGDLGIAVAFQQRARGVLDARMTGTDPGEPWRILLLPQPERICLMVRIDALGIHQIGLYKLDEALSMLTDWLPRGASGSDARWTPMPAHRLERSALVTVTHYTAQGSAEIAGASTDLVLARHDDRLHVLTRDQSDRSKLVPDPQNGKEVPDLLTGLLS